MIGEFVSSSLLLVLGYAYPAFQCFKTVEKNRVEIPELRFWCQYWIIVAVITVLEKIGDVFISWLPMYGEVKLALFIYLWYPKTQGTGYVYETLVRPYVGKHETDIDRSLLEFRERAWNLAIYYWHNCTELGSTKILQFFQFVGSQSARSSLPSSENTEHPQVNASAPPMPPSAPFSRNNSNERYPHVPSPRAYTSYRSQATPKTDTIQFHLHKQTHFVRPEDVLIHDSDHDNGSSTKSGSQHDTHAPRFRLWRFRGSK